MRFIKGIQDWFNIQNTINVIQDNSLKRKKHIIISIDLEKAFDKVQYQFTTEKKKKPLSKLGIEGNFLK